MRGNGLAPTVIRAGKANLFLSNVFIESFVNATQVPVELYDCDGSVGAAIGAGLGAGVYANEKEAFVNNKRLRLIEPTAIARYDDIYQSWNALLQLQIAKPNQ